MNKSHVKKTIAGNTYDTKVDEEIINYDGEWESVCLMRTAAGRYYLDVRKLQAFSDNEGWANFSWWDDGERQLATERRRVFRMIRPLSTQQAIDWYVATIVPECFQAYFKDAFHQTTSA